MKFFDFVSKILQRKNNSKKESEILESNNNTPLLTKPMTKLGDQALSSGREIPILFSKGDTVLDQYWVIEDPIHGGMGTVYPVADSHNRKYIMKTFRIDLALELGEDLVEIFTKEAQQWAALDFHENVVEAYFVKEFKGIPVIFLEYVEGENLRQRFAHRRMNLWEKLDIAIQICAGMKFVHETGNLLHTDIKPENILIGQTQIVHERSMPDVESIELFAVEMDRKFTRPVNVKITDFGVARPLQLGYKRLRKWDVPEILSKDVGGFAYWAPEQFTNPESVDGRADIYSVGVVLFEMFFNHYPFIARNIREFLKQQQQGQLQIPKNIDSNIPSALKQSILQCLETQPDDRYPSFYELREDLVNHMAKLVHNHPEYVPSYFRDIDSYIDFLREGEEKYAVLKNSIPDNLNMKAGTLASLGQYHEAIKWSNRALSIDKLHFDALNTKGVCHLMLGQHREALNCFEDILRVQPSHLTALLNKGHILLIMDKNYDEALSCLERVTTVNPKSADAWSKRGKALQKLGRFKEAIGCYYRALSLQSDLQEPKKGITQCLEQLSNTPWVVYRESDGFDFITEPTEETMDLLQETLSNETLNKLSTPILHGEGSTNFQIPFSIEIQKIANSIKALSVNFSDKGMWIGDGKAIYLISLDGAVQYRQNFPIHGEIMTINEKHDYIIVGNNSGIFSIDFQGNIRWKFPIEGIPALGMVHSVLFIPEKKRIFAVVDSSKYNLLCLSIDGKLLWGRRPENKITEVIAAQEGELIVCNSPDRIYAYGEQGDVLWICSADLHKDTGGFLRAERTDRLCLAKNDGVIYFASLITPFESHYECDIARIHCCDTKGNLQWQKKVQGKILGLSSTDNGEVVVGTYLRKVYYFDRSGSIVWESATPGAVWCVDVCKNGSYMAVAGYKDWVLFYDHTGRLIKEYKTKGDTIRSLKIFPDCHTIAAIGDNLYLFQARFER